MWVLWQSLQLHHCIVWQFDAFIQFAKLAQRGKWHYHLQWQCTRSCVTYMMQEGTNGKRMSCPLLIYHIQISKLIDFRTMDLWKLITFFKIRTACITQYTWPFLTHLNKRKTCPKYPTSCTWKVNSWGKCFWSNKDLSMQVHQIAKSCCVVSWDTNRI